MQSKEPCSWTLWVLLVRWVCSVKPVFPFEVWTKNHYITLLLPAPLSFSTLILDYNTSHRNRKNPVPNQGSQGEEGHWWAPLPLHWLKRGLDEFQAFELTCLSEDEVPSYARWQNQWRMNKIEWNVSYLCFSVSFTIMGESSYSTKTPGRPWSPRSPFAIFSCRVTENWLVLTTYQETNTANIVLLTGNRKGY